MYFGTDFSQFLPSPEAVARKEEEEEEGAKAVEKEE
jgi:hypothetical protein